MIPTPKLINALRLLGYRYKTQTERVELHKKSGSTNRVEVRKRDYQDVDTARATLRRAGMDANEIEKFIAECSVTKH